MHVVADLGSPDDRDANEGHADVDQDGMPLNSAPTPGGGSRMSRRTPSQILGGVPSTTTITPDLEMDATPKSHYSGNYSRPTTFSKGVIQPPGGIDPSVIDEIPNMVLLIVLYMLQGVPLGLTFGTIPMLLASKASYTQVCTTSAAARNVGRQNTY
jgi:MFS transporter, PAT family, solute carrier family 33 (acetyl-CoA transportor), member 1